MSRLKTRLARLEHFLAPAAPWKSEDVLTNDQVLAALGNDVAARPVLTAGQDAFLRDWVRRLLIATAAAGPMPVRGGHAYA